ncbi:hypothetical protein BG011_000073 [Mortierella polycephala]|uniref:Uncharacterized protein n=1 Tax=Mortierella polycephala TaxID=41804 RepID=A0A9P6QBL1_9FUNG|nr:hypothetical protein BG011_000073 [Mortierella polycephala]
MTSLFSQGFTVPAIIGQPNPKPRPPYLDMSKPVPSPSIPAMEHRSTDNQPEDMMMTDSAIPCTPPLDLGSDSGEDDELDYSMRFPLSPLPRTSTQPVSILLHRKRKDSQEHGAVPHLHGRCQSQGQQEQFPSQQEEGYAAAPALDSTQGKGARGRRPTVTFDLDEPSVLGIAAESSPTIIASHIRHSDDDEEESDSDSVTREPITADPTSRQDELENYAKPLANPGKTTGDSLHLTEQALRRVSITPSTVDDDDKNHIPDNDNDNFSVKPLGAKDSSINDKLVAQQESNPTVSPLCATSQYNPPKEVELSRTLHEPVTQDILVAMLDRPSEMEALVAKHPDFFSLINSSLCKTSRDLFNVVVLKPRAELSDRDWMHAIAGHLQSLPICILEKFKGIVGWIGPDCEDDEDEDYHDPLWDDEEYCYRDSSFDNVQIKWLRDLDDFSLETFQKCYPQFFVNCRDRLHGRHLSYGGDQRDLYDIFCETLRLTRKDLLCDNAWTRRMNGCLEKDPELLLQLKEIVAYESEYDD